MGCHVLIQCMKVKSESEVTQSYPTLCDPMDCSLLGSSIHEIFFLSFFFFIHGIFQARVLEWGAIAFSEQRCGLDLSVHCLCCVRCVVAYAKCYTC